MVDGLTGLEIPKVGTILLHFTVATLEGGLVDYRDHWQREQLLLVVLPEIPAGPWAEFQDQLAAARSSCAALETALVVTRDRRWSGDRPFACVADRWGEATHVAELRCEGPRVEPTIETLLSWVQATLYRCPECEGEAR